MGHPSTDDIRVDVDSPGPPAQHIPTEVCENIIDMLYSVITSDTHEDIVALHSCALVCQAWRIRSQRMLFYHVQLSTTTSLCRLSAILDVARHLRDYVYEVELTGYHLHNTTSIFALFPVLFSRKLPNLREVDVIHLSEAYETLLPRTPDPPKSRSLPYIPLHPRFPLFLSSLTAVWSLYLAKTTFRSFTELMRMLHGLPNLEYFRGCSINWITPGGAHPGADLMKLPDWVAGRCILPPFAPNLRYLELADMDVYGVERLIWTRGPHLTLLVLMIPLLYSHGDTSDGQTIDLSSCTGLRALILRITPRFSMDKDAGFVKDLLASWKPQNTQPELEIEAVIEAIFTRQSFADALRDIGTICETWLQAVTELSLDGSFQSDHGVQYQLIVRIRDWNAEKEWWKNHVDSCFPTWVKLGRLSWEFQTPQQKLTQWANEEGSPQPDVFSAASEEDLASGSQSESPDALSSEMLDDGE